MESKKGMESEVLGWLLFGILLLAVILVGIYFMSERGQSAIEFIKQMLRFK